MWEEICKGVAWIVEKFYIPFHDWGMAILLLTIVFRLIILPLMLTQTKSSYQMQKLQPKIKALQEKFSDNPTRLNEETQRLYAEAKFNPLASCIPMLIQMPLFIALFTVLRNIQTYLPDYSSFTFYEIVPNLVTTPADAINQGFFQFLPYAILIIIFVAATFLPSLLQLKNNTDPKQRNQTLMMTLIMGVMMLFVSWSSPAGVLLFWGTSGIIATVVQQVYMHILRKQDSTKAEEIIEVEPVVVEVERKVKKKRPKKKR